MNKQNQFVMLVFTIVIVVLTMILEASADANDTVPDPSQAKKVIKYENALMVGPPEREGDLMPQIHMTDTVVIRDNYAYAYNHDGTQKLYKLGVWSVYTSALPLTTKEFDCDHGRVYVLPKGQDISKLTLNPTHAMCIDFDKSSKMWLVSKDYKDIKTNENLRISEYVDPKTVDVYLIEPNGMLEIIDGEVKMTLQ